MRVPTATPATWDLTKDERIPNVYGVVVDQPIANHTITIVALRDRTASKYTTGTFGVIGGEAHPPIRDATIGLLNAANARLLVAMPTRDFDYPAGDQVHFFLIGYDGVRVIDDKMSELNCGKGDSSSARKRTKTLVSTK